MTADQGDYRSAARSLLDGDEVQCVLSGAFYTPAPQDPRRPRANAVAQPAEKPSHYKVICISMYTDDLQRLDAMVDQLKGKGLTKANRSALIRYALSLVDLDAVPRGL
ncbi:MAG: hypothetical protein MUF54_06215 [Polyangiaceae bacterium]|jgi:hypothetical protein|nr:hypothetical protein [Polyangiaceae bacterium]